MVNNSLSNHQPSSLPQHRTSVNSLAKYCVSVVSKKIALINVRQFIHPKLFISFLIWFIMYTFMGIFGGSVAFYHFPRVSSSRKEPVQLPDLGYDLIPYNCIVVNNSHPFKSNVQSVVLIFFYILTGCCALFRPNGEGRIIVQQLLHLNSLTFFARTFTVGITGLPQPDPACGNFQSDSVTYMEAVQYVVLSGFPFHACGDMIFSGHVSCILMCLVIFQKYNFFAGIFKCTSWILCLFGVYSVIACRSHYSVDVVLAFFFVYFIQNWYFIRSEISNSYDYDGSIDTSYIKNVRKSLTVKFIVWLEDEQNSFKEKNSLYKSKERDGENSLSNIKSFDVEKTTLQ